MHYTPTVFCLIISVALCQAQHHEYEHLEHHEEAGHEPDYKFEYKVNDAKSGDYKAHRETRKGDAVDGYYMLQEADGTMREVHYTSDKHVGFNAVVMKSGTPKEIEEHWHDGGHKHYGVYEEQQPTMQREKHRIPYMAQPEKKKQQYKTIRLPQYVYHDVPVEADEEEHVSNTFNRDQVEDVESSGRDDRFAFRQTAEEMRAEPATALYKQSHQKKRDLPHKKLQHWPKTVEYTGQRKQRFNYAPERLHGI